MTTRRRKRHPPEEIARKIQDADRVLTEGGDVAFLLRQLNMTEADYCRWCSPFGGREAEDAKKLKALEKQDLQMGNLPAGPELEKAVLRELAKAVV